MCSIFLIKPQRQKKRFMFATKYQLNRVIVAVVYAALWTDKLKSVSIVYCPVDACCSKSAQKSAVQCVKSLLLLWKPDSWF